MRKECDLRPVGRKPRVADPTLRFVDLFADGIFKNLFGCLDANDQKLLTVRGPVRFGDVLHDFARRCSAGKRHFGKSAALLKGVETAGVEQNRSLTARRDGHDVYVGRQTHGARFRSARPYGVDLSGFAFPLRGVVDGLPVRTEVRGSGTAAAESQALKSWRLGKTRAPAQEKFSGSQKQGHSNSGKRQEPPPFFRGGCDLLFQRLLRTGGSRNSRNRVKSESQIARGLKSRRRIFFQAMI